MGDPKRGRDQKRAGADLEMAQTFREFVIDAVKKRGEYQEVFRIINRKKGAGGIKQVLDREQRVDEGHPFLLTLIPQEIDPNTLKAMLTWLGNGMDGYEIITEEEGKEGTRTFTYRVRKKAEK